MTFGDAAGLVGAVLLAGTLAARSLELAQRPPFEIGITLHRRPGLAIEGASFAWTHGEIRCEANATRAGLGSQRIGHLAIGPSRFLVLEDVELLWRGADREFVAGAPRATLRGEHLTLEAPVRLRPSDGPDRRLEALSLHLGTGRTSER